MPAKVCPEPLVIITRPLPEALRTQRHFEKAGFGTLIAPLGRVEKYKPVWPDNLGKISRFIITSPRAVSSIPKGKIKPGAKFYVVGDKTAHALKDKGFDCSICVTPDIDRLIGEIRNDYLEKSQDISGVSDKIIYLRGKNITTDIKTALNIKGLDIQEIVTYEVVFDQKPGPDFDKAIHSGRQCVITVFSKRTAHALASYLEKSHAPDIKILTLSKRISVTLEKQGVKECFHAPVPNEAAMIDKLRLMYEKKI